MEWRKQRVQFSCELVQNKVNDLKNQFQYCRAKVSVQQEILVTVQNPNQPYITQVASFKFFIF